MKIEDAKLYATFDGSLKLALLVDEEPPDRDELKFENKDRFWYAEQDGYVDYFIEGADSGLSRTVTTIGGEERSFSGVGAGRASVLNKAGLGPFVDVKLTANEERYERGPGHMEKAAITLEAAEEAAELAGVELARKEDEDGRIIWAVSQVDE